MTHNINLTLTVDLKTSKKDNPKQVMDVASGIDEAEGSKVIEDFHKLMYQTEGDGYEAFYRLFKERKNAGNVISTLAFAFLMDIHMQILHQEKQGKNLQRVEEAIKEGSCPMWDTGTKCNTCLVYDSCDMPMKEKKDGTD